MISHCLQCPIQLSDNRPPNICQKCFAQLKSCYKFCNLARSSEEKFQAIVLSTETMKIEEVDIFPMSGEESNFGHDENSSSDLQMGNYSEMEYISADEEKDKSLILKQPLTPLLPSIVDVKIETDVKSESHNKKSKNKKKNRKAIGGSSTSKRASNKLKTRTKIEEMMFECLKCKENLKTLKFLRQHMKRHRDATPHKCKICVLYFSKQQFHRHLCSGDSIKCEYCGKSFGSSIAILKHLEHHENKSQTKIYKCVDCVRHFPMKSLLEIHLKMYSHARRTLVCTVCNKRYHNETVLYRHMQLHTDDRRKLTFSPPKNII